MTGWNYNDIETVSSRYGAGGNGAESQSPASAPAAAGGSPLNSEEHDRIRDQIQSYSGYPEIQQAFAQIINGAGNPEQVASLLREAVDVIEQVRANPHREIPGVHPALRQVVEAVQAVEREKPDPLNMLRGGDVAASPATFETAVVGNGLMQDLLTGQLQNGLTRRDDEMARLRGLQPAVGGAPSFAVVNNVGASSVDQLSTAAALEYAFNQGPTNVPNLRGGGLARGGIDFA